MSAQMLEVSLLGVGRMDNVMGAQMLEVSPLGVGTVLRLERDAWSTVKRLRQATKEYPPTPVL